MSKSVFILSACSGAKAAESVVNCEDIDGSDRASLVDMYPAASMEASSLYTGDEHEHVKAAVELFEEVASVEWRIVSAGFGVVSPDTVLPSYECTFRDADSVRKRVKRLGMNPSTLTKTERIQAVATDLGIPSAIEESLSHEPDILFIVLGNDYLIATEDALSSIPGETTAFAIAPKGSRDLLGDCSWVPSTEEERDTLSTTWTKVKGRQLRNIADRISNTGMLDHLTAEDIHQFSTQG